MKTETMQDIKNMMANLLQLVGEIHKFTNALSTTLEVKQSNCQCDKLVYSMQVTCTKYLEMLQHGITVPDGSVLPAGTYHIGPNTIKEINGAIHATGCLYFVGNGLQECITQVEITACASRGDHLWKPSPSYKQFFALYAEAEHMRLQQMMQ